MENYEKALLLLEKEDYPKQFISNILKILDYAGTKDLLECFLEDETQEEKDKTILYLQEAIEEIGKPVLIFPISDLKSAIKRIENKAVGCHKERQDLLALVLETTTLKELSHKIGVPEVSLWHLLDCYYLPSSRNETLEKVKTLFHPKKILH